MDHPQMEPPENSPAFDEWCEAQQEKKEMLKKADRLIESFPFAGTSTLDELDDIIASITAALPLLNKYRKDLASLEDDFPGDWEEGE